MDFPVLQKVPEQFRDQARTRLSIVAELEPFFPGLQVKVHLPEDTENGNGVYRARDFQHGIKVHDISADSSQALLAQAQLQNGA